MGRPPCCDKTGLKKGPWTAEEDDILINFINQTGHDNWRALPKRAGLLRCGKSCRLRWLNYLRPDIKRGNFTPEEDEMIIKLHQELGNRWSVIAARLPGRTDNEIKNVWHTHLKKRVNNQTRPKPETRVCAIDSSDEDKNSDINSPVHSLSSEISSLTYPADGADSSENLPEMDESFWSDVLTGDDCGASGDFSGGSSDDWFEFSSSFGSNELDVDGSIGFWEMLSRADYLIELPEF